MYSTIYKFFKKYIYVRHRIKVVLVVNKEYIFFLKYIFHTLIKYELYILSVENVQQKLCKIF